MKVLIPGVCGFGYRMRHLGAIGDSDQGKIQSCAARAALP
jgi:hypothetical protein